MSGGLDGSRSHDMLTSRATGFTVRLRMAKRTATFAETLRKARKVAALTQEQLAQRAKLTVRTIARAENDEHDVSFETRHKLAQVFAELKPYLLN